MKPNPGSSNSYLEYTIDPDKSVRELLVGKHPFTLDESGMPRIEKAEPNPVEKGGTITFTGQNFDKVKEKADEKITVFAENENISNIFSENSTTATLKLSDYRIDMGSNNVEIRREKQKMV